MRPASSHAQPSGGRPSRRAAALAFALAIVTVAAFLVLAAQRDSFHTVSGDEGTYLAMAESLALDGDLRIDKRDVQRLVESGSLGRQAVILQHAGDADFYSKPTLYPLLAAPFYRLAGGPLGLVALNLFALGGALWCAWCYLRRFDPDRALLTLTSFAGAGALLAYVAWRTADLIQVAAVLAGLALCLGPLPRRGLDDPAPTLFASPWAALLGGALLGLAGSLRITNLAMAAAPLVALLLHRRHRRAALVAAGLAGALLAGACSNWVLAGSPSPYRTTRATFDAASGYPTHEVQPLENRYETSFSKVRMRSPHIRPIVSVYAALYFLIGRHSGLLLYTPMALLLLAGALRRPDRAAASLLAAVGGLTVVYLLWLPHNYFGGGACIGNRYFLVAYAALPLAGRPLGWRRLWAGWLLAALAFVSAFQSHRTVGELGRSSQNHAYAGVFRWLPYESTAESIEGNRERFWPKENWENLHFTDPFSRVGAWSFRLSTETPPAELEVANQRPGAPLRFLVLSTAPRLTFVYRDWKHSTEVPLRRPLGPSGLVEIAPAPAWRHHPLWFYWQLQDLFTIRLFTLAIHTPDGLPAEAEIRYLGSSELPSQAFYRRTVLRAELPQTAPAGGTTVVPLEIRNDSEQPWRSDDVLPVHLSYRTACAGLPLVEGPRSQLPDVVLPGEILSTSVEVQWPGVETTCELTVDMVVEGVAWFAAQAGGPLATRSVEVAATPASPTEADSHSTAASATPSRRMSRERSGAGAGNR
jgi:hypothetical protein